MPRNYKRTTNRQSWDAEIMKKAVKSVIEGGMGYLKASTTYGIPKSTLQDRVNKFRSSGDIDLSTSKGLGRFKPVFSSSEEQSLFNHIVDMESRLFGLTYKDLRRLAFEFAEANNIENNFNKDVRLAGEDWLAGFMIRHPQLSLRAAEHTSIARAMGFNQVSVNKFFDLLESMIDQYQFPPTKIFNVDETGITTVPKKQSKIIALKGRKQVGIASSAERGQLTTAVICVSASGYYVPPFMIFPRLRMKAELLDDAPPGTVSVCHPSGWIQSEIFVDWLIHFIASVKPKKDDPVLLLLDGHKAHTQNLPLIEKARQHGVVILSFPPHCTHRLQPLDVSFMGPLSTFYAQEVNKWLRNNPGRVVTQFQIAKLFGLAYCKAATMQNAVSGFNKTGIYPTDRNVFSESDFVAAETTEIIIPDEQQANLMLPTSAVSQAVPVSDNTATKISSTLNTASINPIDVPSTSTAQIENKNSVTPPKSTPGPKAVATPADIMPVPKISSERKRQTNHRKGKTAIITSSPYKNELINISQNKKTKPALNFKQTNKQLKKPQKKTDKNQNLCLYCQEEYGKTRIDEGWVQCITCKGWAHEGCTGWDSDDLDNFECFGCVASR